MGFKIGFVINNPPLQRFLSGGNSLEPMRIRRSGCTDKKWRDTARRSEKADNWQQQECSLKMNRIEQMGIFSRSSEAGFHDRRQCTHDGQAQHSAATKGEYFETDDQDCNNRHCSGIHDGRRRSYHGAGADRFRRCSDPLRRLCRLEEGRFPNRPMKWAGTGKLPAGHLPGRQLPYSDFTIS